VGCGTDLTHIYHPEMYFLYTSSNFTKPQKQNNHSAWTFI
jgi:hypothetical protein